MSKFAENVIKIAYENRANAMIAAKQAAEGEGRLQKMMNWLNDPANKGKATAIESGLGGLAAGGLGFGLTKALGGSNKWAWANAGMAGGGTAAAITGAKYRKEIGDALKSLLKKKEEPRTEPSNGLELRPLDELKKENSNLALGQQTSTVLAQMAANAKEIERREKELGPIEQQIAMLNDGNPEHAQLLSELQAKQSDLRQGRGSKYTVTKNEHPDIPIGSRSGNWNPDGTVKP